MNCWLLFCYWTWADLPGYPKLRMLYLSSQGRLRSGYILTPVGDCFDAENAMLVSEN